MVSDEYLLKLWRDPNFSGSYRGIKTFQVLLKTDKNIDVTEKRLYQVLKKDRIFLIHQRPIRNFDRRPYDIRYYGETVQADIAYMFPFDNYQYFLLVVDCFSLKIFALPLKAKSSPVVGKAFENIFEAFNAPIHVLETDRGKEFIGCKKLFKNHNIYYKSKFGQNKANFAEWAIFIIKRKLYMLLRGNLSQDWVNFLPKVVESYNHTPSKKLGGIAPETIHSEIDSVRVTEAQKNSNIKVYHEPNFHQQQENQLNYDKNKDTLKPGTFVYLTTNEDLFAKSFDVKVRLFYLCL
jgi:hypothetical protein